MSEAVQRDFTQRIVAVALLVRLLAITVALFGMIGQPITGTMLASVLVLSATSFSFLMYPSVATFVVHHPLAVVADLLLTLLVLAALGVESPLVLATFSTALIMGILFELGSPSSARRRWSPASCSSTSSRPRRRTGS